MNNKINYDQLWNKREDMKIYGPMSRHIRKLIWKLIQPLHFNSVIDIGCGAGILLSELNSKKPDVKLSGIDISDHGLKLAKKRLPNISFHKLDITKKNLNNKFDLVICSEVLEHLEKDQDALNNISIITNKYLILSTKLGKMRSLETNIGHVRNYDLEDLIVKIKKSAFTIAKVIQWGFPFYSPLYRNLFEQFPTHAKSFSTGKFSQLQKIVSTVIYWLFYLNCSNRGDQLVILAKKAKPSS